MASDLGPLLEYEDQPTTIIHATGSGGTTAGLILGVRLLKLNAQVVGINVCKDRNYFLRVVGEICENAIDIYQLEIPFSRHQDIHRVDGSVGEGYGKASPQVLSLLVEVARSEGVVFDPVYTGKAFYGMTEELRRNPTIFGSRVVFVHTGGIFGLLPMAAQLESLI